MIWFFLRILGFTQRGVLSLPTKERKDCAKSVFYPVQLLMLNPLDEQGEGGGGRVGGRGPGGGKERPSTESLKSSGISISNFYLY